MIFQNRIFLCYLLGVAFFLSACAKIRFVEFDPIFVRANAVGSNVYRVSLEKKIDILNTKLDLSFNWDSSLVYGQATILAQPYFSPQGHLILNAKGFKIHKIRLVNSTKNQDLVFTYQDNKIDITLDKTYQPQEQFAVFISYTAMPEKLKIGKDINTKDDRGLYFVNKNKPNKQIWSQGETECNSGWFPTIEDPAEKMTQQFNITVDKNLKTLSNGILLSSKYNSNGTKTDSWDMKQPHSVYLAMIAVGDFTITEDCYRDIKLNYYTEPEFASSAKAIFGRTPEMMAFFADTLNYDFAWPKYDQIIVRNFVSGAMENTTAAVFYDKLYKTAGQIADENEDAIIAHELFHHWFGNLVTAESWANLALNEAFATYAEYLWIAHKYGNAAADEHLMIDAGYYFDYRKIRNEDLIRFDYADKDQMFDQITYQKGALILHMLRKEVGDEAFFLSLNLYLKTHEFKTAEGHDLRLAFEEITGRDLNWFFNQWFFSNSNPLLEISKFYDEEKKELKITVNQIKDSLHKNDYLLPVQIKIVTNGTVKFHDIIISKVYEEFTFPTPSKPDYVKFDTKNQLLIEQEVDKTDLDYANQFKYADDFIDRIEAVNYFEFNQSNKCCVQLISATLTFICKNTSLGVR
jgi:aminopeptidase N